MEKNIKSPKYQGKWPLSGAARQRKLRDSHMSSSGGTCRLGSQPVTTTYSFPKFSRDLPELELDELLCSEDVFLLASADLLLGNMGMRVEGWRDDAEVSTRTRVGIKA